MFVCCSHSFISLKKKSIYPITETEDSFVPAGLISSGSYKLLVNQLIVFLLVTLWISSTMTCILLFCTFLENIGVRILKESKKGQTFEPPGPDNYHLPVLSGESSGSIEGRGSMTSADRRNSLNTENVSERSPLIVVSAEKR
jgi:hypothetical protein